MILVLVSGVDVQLVSSATLAGTDRRRVDDFRLDVHRARGVRRCDTSCESGRYVLCRVLHGRVIDAKRDTAYIFDIGSLLIITFTLGCGLDRTEQNCFPSSDSVFKRPISRSV